MLRDEDRGGLEVQKSRVLLAHLLRSCGSTRDSLSVLMVVPRKLPLLKPKAHESGGEGVQMTHIRNVYGAFVLLRAGVFVSRRIARFAS